MANYYVRPDGNNTNAGTGYLASQAWQTISKALSVTMGTAENDYIYVAPGFYAEQLTLSYTPANYVLVTGDPSCSMFLDCTPGEVIVSGSNSLHAAATRAYAIDLNAYQYYYFENLTLYPGTTATIASSTSSVKINYLYTCKVIGKILNVKCNTATSWQFCEFIACTLEGSYYLQFDMCIFHSLVVTNSKFYAIGCYINLGGVTLSATTYNFNLKACYINVYPSSTTGYAIIDAAGATGNLNILANTIYGVGGMVAFAAAHPTLSYGNDVHNMDAFIDRAANSTASTFDLKDNTFYNCKYCFRATNSSYPITATQCTTSNFIRCDSFIDGYVTADSTCVLAYGGRPTGTGYSDGITAVRLPYESDLTGRYITETGIEGYDKGLCYRTGTNAVFFAWVPVIAGQQRTVTFYYNCDTSISGQAWVVLGLFNEVDALSTAYETTNQLMTIQYTSFYTGYVPLYIYFPAGSTSTTHLIEDLKWT